MPVAKRWCGTSFTQTGGTNQITAGTMTFSGGTYYLNGGTLMMNGSPAAFGASTLSWGGGTLSGGSSLPSSLSVTLSGTGGSALVNGGLTINAPVSGPGGLTKASAGLLALTSANTFSGDTTIQGGGLVRVENSLARRQHG